MDWADYPNGRLLLAQPSLRITWGEGWSRRIIGVNWANNKGAGSRVSWHFIGIKRWREYIWWIKRNLKYD